MTLYILFTSSIIAVIILVPLERNVSRDDIECPGDTIPYRCSIQSNSETVQLTWRVTLPGQTAINITYDNTSSLNTEDNLAINVITTLTEFTIDEYIESTIVFRVLSDVAMNQTKLDCVSEDLDEETLFVFVNTTGMYSVIIFGIIFNTVMSYSASNTYWL